MADGIARELLDQRRRAVRSLKVSLALFLSRLFYLALSLALSLSLSLFSLSLPLSAYELKGVEVVVDEERRVRPQVLLPQPL